MEDNEIYLEAGADVVKVVGGLAIGYCTKKVVDEGVDILIDNSEYLQEHELIANIGKYGIGMCAGTAVGYCWNKKIDGAMHLYKVLKTTSENLKKEKEEAES